MLGTVASRVNSWVRTNVVGAASEDALAGKPAGDIDRDYGRIEDGLGKVKGDLDRIDEDTKLRPPALKNFKNAELIMLGAGVGGAIGGGLGIADSLITSAVARPEVVISETKVPIFSEKLTGSTFVEVPRYDEQPVFNSSGQQVGTTRELVGWDVRHTPSITQERIGEYTQRTHEIKTPGSGSPLTSGLVGLGIGMGVGAGLGALIAVGRKAVGQGYEEHERREVKGETQLLIKTGAVGAVIGGGVGLLNGLMESNNAVSQSYNTEAPVTEHRVLGQIPSDYFKSALSANGGNTPGTVNIERDVPKTGFFGRPEVDKNEVQVQQDGRFGLVGGLVGGVVVGGIAGVGIGVALNVLRRTI